MTIYIPVLFVCIAETCNFMQGQTPHKTEASCRASIDLQKAYMTVISNEANQGKITLLEGTCINVELPRSSA